MKEYKKVCPICKMVFYSFYRNRQKFCSDNCRYEYHNTRRAKHAKRSQVKTKQCQGCGESFLAQRSTAKYCSDACRQKTYRQNNI